MKKKYVLVLLVLILALALTSCGTKKAEAKLAEKLSEKILEKATGTKVDLDLSDEKGLASIKSDDVEMSFGSSLAWPVDKLPGIPEARGVDVVSLAEMSEEYYFSLTFTGLDQAGMKAYLKELKEAGFRTISESNFNGVENFSGANKDGQMLTILYSYDEDQELGTTIMTLSKSELDDFKFLDEESFVNDDLSKWPRGFIEGLPELEGDIVSQIISSELIIISFENIQEARLLSYVEELKVLGFTEEAVEVSTQQSTIYSANNQEGERVSLSWDDQGNIHLQLSKED
ncbi:MAG: hypothetical protein GX079_04495 [Tissierellia bacterium]|nr:hypothetical protein [Tissierellia bacterium]